MTPKLVKAARRGDFEIVQTLVQRGLADVSYKKNQALYFAIKYNRWSVIRYLVSKVQMNEDNGRCFIRACMNRYYSTIDLLLRQGADIHFQDFRALEFIFSNEKIIYHPNLHEQFRSITELPTQLLKTLSKNDHIDVFLRFVAQQSDLNNSLYSNIVEFLFKYDHLDKLPILFNYSKINKLLFNCILSQSCMHGHRYLAQCAINHGAEASMTHLIQAIENLNYSCADLILMNGVDIKKIPSDVFNKLYLTHSNKSDIIFYLLSHEYKLDITENSMYYLDIKCLLLLYTQSTEADYQNKLFKQIEWLMNYRRIYDISISYHFNLLNIPPKFTNNYLTNDVIQSMVTIACKDHIKEFYIDKKIKEILMSYAKTCDSWVLQEIQTTIKNIENELQEKEMMFIQTQRQQVLSKQGPLYEKYLNELYSLMIEDEITTMEFNEFKQLYEEEL